MAEVLQREFATTASGSPIDVAGLTLDEKLHTGIWTVNAGCPEELAEVAISLAGRVPEIGEMMEIEQLILFRYRPDSLYLLFAVENTPDVSPDWAEYITDISHGVCALNLKGERASTFIGDYLSVNLDNHIISELRMVRCLIGHYKVLLWWCGRDDIHILVERSYAQSFCDYLVALSARWSACQPH